MPRVKELIQEVQHPPLDLWAAKDVADHLGVRVSNLKPYDPVTKQGIRGLPEPVCETSAGRVWFAPNIRWFARQYQTRKRPRGRAAA